jgi:hypothetical protein
MPPRSSYNEPDFVRQSFRWLGREGDNHGSIATEPRYEVEATFMGGGVTFIAPRRSFGDRAFGHDADAAL